MVFLTNYEAGMEMIKVTKYSLCIEAFQQAIHYQQSLIDAMNRTILVLNSPDQLPLRMKELVIHAKELNEKAQEELEAIQVLHESHILVGNFWLVPKDEAIPADFNWRDYLQ